MFVRRNAGHMAGIDRTAARSGCVDALPLLVAELPFGLVVGVAAASAGLQIQEGVALSATVFTGAAQLAGLDLIGDGAPVLAIVVTMVMVNLRYLMYSASMAPYFRDLRRGTRWLFAYLLTDPVYALSITTFREREDPAYRRWYYLGAAVPLWFAYQFGTLLGVVFGARLPPSWHLEFAVPLLFLVLLIPTLEDRATAVTAVVAAGAALAVGGLPLELGFFAAALVGIVAGLATERYLDSREVTRGH